MTSETWFLGGLGAALLLVSVYDFVRSTIADGQGPVSYAAARATHRVFRALSRIAPPGRLAHAVGPCALIAAAGSWVLIDWVALTLLFGVERAVIHAEATQTPTFSEILGHAGATFSTLGSSRVTAGNGWWNTLAAAGAVLGMLTLTLVVSYLLNIISTVTQGRVLAMRLNLMLERRSPPGASELDEIASGLTQVAVALQVSPLAALYDVRDEMQSLPRAVLALCDAIDARDEAGEDEETAASLTRIDAALARLKEPGRRPYAGNPRENARLWARRRGLRGASA